MPPFSDFIPAGANESGIFAPTKGISNVVGRSFCYLYIHMKKIYTLLSLFIMAGGLAAISCTGKILSEAASTEPLPSLTPASKPAKVPTTSDDVFDGQKIVKSEEEWKKELSAEAYHVLREEGTERPFTGEYANNHEDGDYYCAACHLKLFSSKAKFESGTGWPSFFEPINKKNVVEKSDRTLGMVRTEVECARCGSHLGHVFDDGPKPTGLRYCMNSISLKFQKTN